MSSRALISNGLKLHSEPIPFKTADGEQYFTMDLERILAMVS